MELKLTGLTALVTGGATGVGFGIAKALTQEGVKVTIAGRREEVLKKASLALENSKYIVIDIAKEDSGEALYKAAGPVDIVVNCAGASRVIGLKKDEDGWNENYLLRVKEMRRLMEKMLPSMTDKGFGRIINVGGGFEVQSVINAASVMNAARTVYSKSLSHMVAKDGITVNTIALGFIESEQMEKAPPPISADQIPVGYFGKPEDVGNIVAFLVSPLARYMTGEIIGIDGGFHRFAF